MSDDLNVGGVKDRGHIIALKSYWKDIRLDWTSGDLDYKGVHFVHDAATSDTNWEIWKFTWSGGNPTRIEGPLVGAWDNRASLSWGS